MSSGVYKFQFRLVLLGSNGTGFLFKKFETKYKPTVEDLFSKDFDLGAIEIKVDFLDTSGSMQFPAMRRLSITTGNAFLIVYSVDDPNSLDVLKMCVAEIQEARPDDFQEVPIVFAGNKLDTPKEQRKVTKEQVSNYVYYELPRLRTRVIECSCKDNINVDSIFKAYLSLAKVRLPCVSGGTPPPPKSGSKKRMSAHSINNNPVNPNSEICSACNRCDNCNNPDGHQQSGNSSPTPLSSSSSSGNNNNNNNNHHHHNNDNSAKTQQKRSSSIKLALGVRKSCDASIVSSMRKVSLSGSGARGSREQHFANCMREIHAQETEQTTEVVLRDAMSAGSLVVGAGAPNNPQASTGHRSGCGFGRSGSHSSSANRLAVEQGGAKPRSRSLIWRPSRKSSKPSASSDASECRVT